MEDITRSPEALSRAMRGIGQVYARQPIGAVLQIGWRQKDESGRWKYVGAFGGSEKKGMKRCFNIMTAVPNTKIKRGTMDVPARSLHPDFARFNSADPEKCMSIRAVLVNKDAKDAYRKSLGAFKCLSRDKNPPSGWFCKGDAQKAVRWDAASQSFREIACPAEACEFRQEGSGPKNQGTLCKCNLSLLAQFRWASGDLPQLMFQWDSKSWNNAGNLEGLFGQVDEAAGVLGYPNGTFPVMGLPITLTLSQKVKESSQFPIVSLSVDGDVFSWAKIAHRIFGSTAGGRQALGMSQAPAPRALQLEPPEGFTPDEMDAATEAALNPDYRPANVREAAEPQ